MRLRLAAALTFVVLGASASAAEAPAPGIGFKDCPDCPEMVVIAPGSFARGSPAREPGRSPNEGPRQIVTIPHRFALGKYELTKAQYAAFVAATGHRSNDPCMYLTEGDWANGADKDWRDPGFRQGSDEPVVCASWNDATAYARWLNAKTGRAYRLPTGAEWEYATRAGGQTARPWGGAPDGACRSANVYDQTALADLGITSPVHSCRDGYVYTAPAGSFRANAFGLHDVIGNVFEWVVDCASGSYRGAPVDGSALELDGCEKRDARGGCWYNGPSFSRSAFRFGFPQGFRGSGLGFRMALTLAP